MKIKFEIHIPCNEEKNFSPDEKVTLLQFIQKNLHSGVSSTDQIEEYLLSLQSALDLEEVNEVDSETISTDLHGLRKTFNTPAKAYTFFKHLLITLFLKSSLKASDLLFLRKFVDITMLDLLSCRRLVSRIHQIDFDDHQNSSGVHQVIDFSNIINLMSEKDKESFFTIILNLVNSDEEVQKDELDYLRDILDHTDLDPERKLDLEKLSQAKLDSFQEGAQLALLQAMLKAAKIDGVIQSIEKLCLIKLIL